MTELQELRTRYRELTGEQASAKWSEWTLKQKIYELRARRAQAE